jgi:hypothetical protein
MKCNLYVAAILSFLVITRAQAQLPDAGLVMVHISSANQSNRTGISLGAYEFSINTGSNQDFASSDDKEYVDCSFGTDFTKGTKDVNITGTIPIWHPKSGQFLLRKGANGNDPSNLARFSLNINNETIIADQKNGTGGTVGISSFSKDGFITGSFDVTVGDSPDPQSILHLYRITGTFRLKNSQD